MRPDRLVIIDGYNLILRNPRLRPDGQRSLEEAREKLINLLSWAVGSGEVKFIVVFDGAENAHGDRREGRVEVRFTRPPVKADDLIRQLVEEMIQKIERVTVVTADLEVARHARAMGADVALSDLFLASTLGPEASEETEKPTQLSRKELEEWAEIFRRRSGAAPDDDEGGTPH